MARTAAMASPCLAGGKGAKVPRRRVDTLAKKTPKFRFAGKFTRRSPAGSLSLTTEFPEHGSGAPAQHEAPACFMALNTLYVQRAFAAQ